ncbi:uncharacterized protein DEA37_0004964 [Paragonimus westermani]|uniref:Serine-threonine/tyrosine-protein kinase catalytic domain-containing protein n=1 Tax=Paragonimus westermani TaxID=34504 RepID=A0A5J4P1Y3_9TREM|nr:uncharacterized protein DEA37_0004964 [Paragonimus westermani]
MRSYGCQEGVYLLARLCQHAIKNVISFLERGERMSRPPGCPTAVFDLMLSCWSADRKARPTFYQLRSSLSEVLSQISAPG